MRSRRRGAPRRSSDISTRRRGCGSTTDWRREIDSSRSPGHGHGCACRRWDRDRPCCSSTAPSVRVAWPSLIAGMPGFRSLVLDRPGWGLSTPVEYPTQRLSCLRRRPARRVARWARHRPDRRGRRVDRRRLGAQPCRTPSGSGRPRSCSWAADRSSPTVARAGCHPGTGLADRRHRRPPAPEQGSVAIRSCARTDTTPASRTGASPDELLRVASGRRQRDQVDAPRAGDGPRHRPWIGLAAGLHVRGRPARPDRRSRHCSSTGPPTRPGASTSGGA